MNGYRGVVFGSVTMISLIYNIIEFLSTRLAYPIFILNDLLDEFDKTPGIAVHMLYDIACLLESHLQVLLLLVVVVLLLIIIITPR